jgi:hypothetical protein
MGDSWVKLASFLGSAHRPEPAHMPRTPCEATKPRAAVSRMNAMPTEPHPGTPAIFCDMKWRLPSRSLNSVAQNPHAVKRAAPTRLCCGCNFVRADLSQPSSSSLRGKQKDQMRLPRQKWRARTWRSPNCGCKRGVHALGSLPTKLSGLPRHTGEHSPPRGRNMDALQRLALVSKVNTAAWQPPLVPRNEHMCGRKHWDMRRKGGRAAGSECVGAAR